MQHGYDIANEEAAADEAREIELNRKDAARYQWLRDVAWGNGMADVMCLRYGPEEWDDYIDRAIEAEALDAARLSQADSPSDEKGERA